MFEKYNNKIYLDEGDHGVCYLIGANHDKVLKIFKEPKDIKEVENLKYLSKFNNKNFFFPFEFICKDDKLLGYISKRALGKKLFDVIDDIPFTNLAESSRELDKSIETLTDNGIMIYDMHSRNVIYDGKTLQIIDADTYERGDLSNKEEIVERNYLVHKMLLSDLFILPYQRRAERLSGAFGEYKKYTEQFAFKKLKEYRYANVSVPDFILGLKYDLENYYKEKIDTLSDIEKIINR